jgi:hypothetical protein
VRSFLLKLTSLTLGIGLAYYLLSQYVPAKFIYPNFWWILFLFFVVTFLFHRGLINSLKKDSKAFVRYYMGGSGAKLGLFLIVILIYAFINKANAMKFALTFFLFYIFYTVFEVSIAYKQFGSKQEKNSIEENKAS